MISFLCGVAWQSDFHSPCLRCCFFSVCADIIEDLYSPRTAAMDFVNELVRKRGKGNLQKFIQFIVGIFMRYGLVLILHILYTFAIYDLIQVYCCSYDQASIELKPYRQKDGALLAIGTLCDRLKQTDPYKGELERMLVQHVFPEFGSHVGHLRAKVVCSTWLAVAFSLFLAARY